MTWVDKAIHWIKISFIDPTIIVCGSAMLALLFVLILLWVESKIRNRKNKDE